MRMARKALGKLGVPASGGLKTDCWSANMKPLPRRHEAPKQPRKLPQCGGGVLASPQKKSPNYMKSTCSSEAKKVQQPVGTRKHRLLKTQSIRRPEFLSPTKAKPSDHDKIKEVDSKLVVNDDMPATPEKDKISSVSPPSAYELFFFQKYPRKGDVILGARLDENGDIICPGIDLMAASEVALEAEYKPPRVEDKPSSELLLSESDTDSDSSVATSLDELFTDISDMEWELSIARAVDEDVITDILDMEWELSIARAVDEDIITDILDMEWELSIARAVDEDVITDILDMEWELSIVRAVEEDVITDILDMEWELSIARAVDEDVITDILDMEWELSTARFSDLDSSSVRVCKKEKINRSHSQSTSPEEEEQLEDPIANVKGTNCISETKNEILNMDSIIREYDPPERDAKLANEALKKNGLKSLQVIAEIACASSSDYLMAVRQAYCSLFDCSLEEDIASQVSPPLRKLLAGLVSSYRQSKEIVDLNVAKSEAAKLHELINGKHLDHDDLMFILSARNFFQLRATFDCYKQEYGEGIAQDISNSGNGDLEALLKVVISCIACPEKHFAEDMRASIEGLGTDGDSLTRAIVRRAEVDMVKIEEEYLKMYGSSIDNAVAGDTSGDYKEFLLTSIGNEDHVATIKEYRGKIEAELSKICDGTLGLLESHLIPSASSAESKVFYLKMKGDYHRYLTEFKTGAERKEAAENTLMAYKSAQDIALAELAPTPPIRLGLALNFPVFYCEILNSPDRARTLAKQLFTWGWNQRGALGHPLATKTENVPSRVKEMANVKIVQAAIGGWHCLAVDDQGCACAWGGNEYGSCGEELEQKNDSGRPLSGDIVIPQHRAARLSVRQVAAGGVHSVVLTREGHVWTWGQPWPPGDIKKISVPVRMQGLERVQVIAIRAFHNLALEEDGILWAWGDNEYGQLGTGDIQRRAHPVPVQGLFGVTLVAIAAGGWQSTALTYEGQVYGWGRREHGRLGFGDDKITRVVKWCHRSTTYRCGRHSSGTHSVALTHDGRMFSYGRGDHGRLGYVKKVTTGHPMEGPMNLPPPKELAENAAAQGHWWAKLVACGGRHTLAIVECGLNIPEELRQL